MTHVPTPQQILHACTVPYVRAASSSSAVDDGGQQRDDGCLAVSLTDQETGLIIYHMHAYT